VGKSGPRFGHFCLRTFLLCHLSEAV